MKPTPETTDPVQRAATARPMGVRLGAGIVSCALLGAGLLFVPTTAQAADAVYSVTDASDDGMDPVPGSLRYAFEEIAADSAAGGPAKDYVVEIAADVDTIELETDLETMLLEGAKSFTLRSLGAEHSLIDMGENAVQVSAEGGDTGVSFSDVDFVNGHVLGARFAEGGTLTLSDVSVSGVEQGLIDGASATTLANSTLVDSDWQVIGAEGGELLLNTSEFSNAPVSADLPGGDALVKGSRFHSNTLDEVLQVTGAVGDQEELQSFVFQGNSVVGNQAGGVRVSHAVETQVTDSTFEDNQGTSGISVEGADVPGSTLVVSDVTFTGNSYAEAPLMVIGSLHAATVANSTFVGNSGEQSGTIRFDAALEEQGATLTEDLLAPRTFRVADNVLQSNDSHYESVVTIGEWLQHVGAAVNVERNLFAENISQSAASDIDIEQLGEGHEDSDEVLRLVDNTFTGSMSLPGKGQSIHLGWVDGARVEVLNNTFDVEADGEPALHIDDLDSNGELDIAFATFSGGGVRVGHYEDIESSPVTLQSTVFDTPSDPVLVDCDCDVTLRSADIVTTELSERIPDAEVQTSQAIALLPLADNGGPTPTQLPDANSVLLGKTQTAPTVPNDQRGVPRPSGPGSDIGAVQRVSGSVALKTDVTVTEGDDVVIPVVRTGSSGFVFELDTDVELATEDGTAKTGVDFTGQGGTVSFAGESAVLDPAQQDGVLTIPTLARSGAQGDRSFTVSIVSTTNGAVIREPKMVTVTIQDSDSGANANAGAGANANANANANAGAGAGANANASAASNATANQGADGAKPHTNLARTGDDGAAAGFVAGAVLLLLGIGAVVVARARRSALNRQ